MLWALGAFLGPSLVLAAAQFAPPPDTFSNYEWMPVTCTSATDKTKVLASFDYLMTVYTQTLAWNYANTSNISLIAPSNIMVVAVAAASLFVGADYVSQFPWPYAVGKSSYSLPLVNHTFTLKTAPGCTPMDGNPNLTTWFNCAQASQRAYWPKIDNTPIGLKTGEYVVLVVNPEGLLSSKTHLVQISTVKDYVAKNTGFTRNLVVKAEGDTDVVGICSFNLFVNLDIGYDIWPVIVLVVCSAVSFFLVVTLKFSKTLLRVIWGRCLPYLVDPDMPSYVPIPLKHRRRRDETSSVVMSSVLTDQAEQTTEAGHQNDDRLIQP